MRSAGLLNNGAVAQLGERQNRTLEVGSSTLLCSTKDYEGLGNNGCLAPSSFGLFFTIFSLLPSEPSKIPWQRPLSSWTEPF